MDGPAITEQQRVSELIAEVPVVEVTLLEDRALVVRRGVLELAPGRSRLRVAKVAPVLVDKTLSAGVALPRDGAQAELPDELWVRSASVTRRRITRDVDRPPNIAELRERRRAKQTEITDDVSWAAQDRRRWAEQIDQLEAAQPELTLALRRMAHEHEALSREIRDLEALESASSSLATHVEAFSTERPSLGVTPPTLATDYLQMRKKGPTVEVEARDQTIHTAGLGTGEGGKQKVADSELPGIDDGGEALGLRGRIKATVPSDGRPYRVPIFQFEAPAETALVCMPERVEAVLLRSRHVNAAEHPLLAGPVDLIRNSGMVGRTSILFIAPGERFELGWGPDLALRVSHTVESLEHERKMMSSWTRKPRRVRVLLSNLAPTPATVEVTEPIAVSEVAKVEVELIEASHGEKADEDGFVTWTSKLKGFAHDELELTWVLVVHDDVAGL